MRSLETVKATDGVDVLVDSNNNPQTNTDLNVMFFSRVGQDSSAWANIISPLYFWDVYLRSQSQNSGALTDIASFLLVNVCFRTC